MASLAPSSATPDFLIASRCSIRLCTLSEAVDSTAYDTIAATTTAASTISMAIPRAGRRKCVEVVSD